MESLDRFVVDMQDNLSDLVIDHEDRLGALVIENAKDLSKIITANWEDQDRSRIPALNKLVELNMHLVKSEDDIPWKSIRYQVTGKLNFIDFIDHDNEDLYDSDLERKHRRDLIDLHIEVGETLGPVVEGSLLHRLLLEIDFLGDYCCLMIITEFQEEAIRILGECETCMTDDGEAYSIEFDELPPPTPESLALGKKVNDLIDSHLKFLHEEDGTLMSELRGSFYHEATKKLTLLDFFGIEEQYGPCVLEHTSMSWYPAELVEQILARHFMNVDLVKLCNEKGVEFEHHTGGEGEYSDEEEEDE